MNNIIVGTAGHIDHGKTTLVRALTGIDTDRLKEEKERGISIDLGFAHLRTADGARIAFVDVPGHERFVRNMLAGASGIDLVLLVIAADEGVKPQTREHFDICRLLGIGRGVVALTKADLVDDEWLALMRMEVEDFVRGTFLAGAPIVAVSGVQRAGLEELERAIVAAAGPQRRRDAARAPRLPIDRAFVMKGHGTVVTGTLTEGRLTLDSEVELYPGGRLARVRGLQVHGEKVKEVTAGQRAAVNLAGVDVADVERGMVAGPVGVYRSSRVLDAQIEWLGEALRDRTRVQFHAGTAEVAGELRLLGGPWARLVLRHPVLVLPGDRFILRRMSPPETIAGGIVRELQSEGRLRRKGAAERLEKWKCLDRAGQIESLVAERPVGMPLAELRWRLGSLEHEIPADLERVANWVVAPASLRRVGAELVRRLREHHRAHPLEPGLSREALRSALLGEAPAAVMERAIRHAPSVRVEGDLLRLESHRMQLQQDEGEASAKIETAFRQAGLAAPAIEEVLRSVEIDAGRARAVLAILLRGGALVRVGPELVLHREALKRLQLLLAERKGQRFGVAEFKDWTGVSRKYAIPLLEYLDGARITRRVEDARVVN